MHYSSRILGVARSDVADIPTLFSSKARNRIILRDIVRGQECQNSVEHKATGVSVETATLFRNNETSNQA
jgi:hypothetical protein